MEAVGYDMYLRLLSEAVSEKRGEAPIRKTEECLVDIQIDAHIPEKYISNLSQRIDVYKKIACVRTETDCMEMLDELIDRFGDPPGVGKRVDRYCNAPQHGGNARFHRNQSEGRRTSDGT